MYLMASFQLIWNNYQSNKKVSMSELYGQLGWDDLIKNPAYANTCAVRVHLACLAAGLSIPGRIKIKKGPYKGHFIEPGQRKLSDLLKSQSLLGEPTVYQASNLLKDPAPIWQKTGIISFMSVPGYLNGNGGHIDVLKTGSNVDGAYLCGSDCYWNAKEVWFWSIL
jgi:hypothetical protein